MANLKRMSGTPWHVEKMTRAEGDDKRDRKKCINHRKEGNYCSVYAGKCRGSAHCPEYKTVERYVYESGIYGDKIYISAERAKKLFPIGSNVKHVKFGKGIVRKIDDEYITIAFGPRNLKKLDLNVCLRNNMLSRGED